MVDTRIILRIVKLDQIEQNEKSQAEAKLQFNIERDIEKEKLTKYERQARWILHLPGGSID
jgi:hypothetical protein